MEEVFVRHLVLPVPGVGDADQLQGGAHVAGVHVTHHGPHPILFRQAEGEASSQTNGIFWPDVGELVADVPTVHALEGLASSASSGLRFDLAQRRGLGDPQQQLVYLRNLKAQIVCRNVANELDPLGVIAYQSSPAPGGFPVRKQQIAHHESSEGIGDDRLLLDGVVVHSRHAAVDDDGGVVRWERGSPHGPGRENPHTHQLSHATQDHAAVVGRAAPGPADPLGGADAVYQILLTHIHPGTQSVDTEGGVGGGDDQCRRGAHAAAGRDIAAHEGVHPPYLAAAPEIALQEDQLTLGEDPPVIVDGTPRGPLSFRTDAAGIVH